MKVIVGITGATGARIGVRLLEELAQIDTVETFLVMSKWAKVNLKLETSLSPKDVEALANHCFHADDLAAPISSGSFQADAMVVAPCSMKTLAGVRCGYADDLIVRACDVILKERKPLVLMPRELPLNEIHLENMLALCKMGVIICPPMPAFYNNPQTIDDLIDHIVYRVLDQLKIPSPKTKRWHGVQAAQSEAEKLRASPTVASLGSLPE